MPKSPPTRPNSTRSALASLACPREIAPHDLRQLPPLIPVSPVSSSSSLPSQAAHRRRRRFSSFFRSHHLFALKRNSSHSFLEFRCLRTQSKRSLAIQSLFANKQSPEKKRKEKKFETRWPLEQSQVRHPHPIHCPQSTSLYPLSNLVAFVIGHRAITTLFKSAIVLFFCSGNSPQGRDAEQQATNHSPI